MIYIACPAEFATGGTELLHQLGSTLINHTSKVCMYYFNAKEGVDPVADRFKKYNVRYVTNLVDSDENIIIFPETATELCKNFNKSKKVIWWLSVDNYYNSLYKSFAKNTYLSNKHLLKLRILKRLNEGKDFSVFDNNILHFYQSQYAKDFLDIKGITNKEYLSDYLNDSFLDVEEIPDAKKRNNVVLYNPAKGKKFTNKIISTLTDINFIPLQNMSPNQIIELCKTSKVYIDFGNHPGKDRFPRESAVLGCCIITGMDGSANNDIDIPILRKYKTLDKVENIESIHERILEVFNDYDKYSTDFNPYREIINEEKNIFERDVEKVYNKHIKPFLGE